MRKLCRHCGGKPVSRPRNLCWNCYYTPGVKETYPPVSKYGRRGPGNFRGQCADPAFPTDALPGSEAKLQVLEERVSRRQNLWHPDDATLAGSRSRHQAAG